MARGSIRAVGCQPWARRCGSGSTCGRRSGSVAGRRLCGWRLCEASSSRTPKQLCVREVPISSWGAHAVIQKEPKPSCRYALLRRGAGALTSTRNLVPANARPMSGQCQDYKLRGVEEGPWMSFSRSVGSMLGVGVGEVKLVEKHRGRNSSTKENFLDAFCEDSYSRPCNVLHPVGGIMARCTRTWGLEVHHIRRDGGNSIENAEVLCQSCHKATSTYGVVGSSPPPFDQSTKDRALRAAGNRCQCTRVGGCH